MEQTFEIKRKVFTVLEKINETAYKVERKNKIYYLRQFANREDFDAFLKICHRFSITAIDVPKVYYFDKSLFTVVLQYIEGESILDMLIKGDLDEKFYEMIFKIEWYAHNEKMILDFHPDQFIYDGKKLYYIGFKYCAYNQKESFAMNDIKYWFYTKDFANYLSSKGLPVDNSRIGNEYAKNKEMALMACKYYL
ncbi:MAG: hypothetical protein K6F07_00395 [Bacilli bacterium]|nr:hypothetical protein [Bacilli bacterium]